MLTEKAISRELMGKIVDEVFDGAIEDASVIEEIYACIKRHEAALSTDAEPVGFLVHDKDNPEGRFYKRKPSISQEDMSEHEIWIEPLYAAPPAPSVAMKALEWEDDGICIQAITSFGFSYGVFCVDWEGEPYWQVSCVDGRYASEIDAKSAAQADYEARIRSALSAQVQDVSGWQTVPPETVIEEATKGRQVLAFENGRYYNSWLEFEGSEGGWLWFDDADSEPNPSHWMPLPAAPAAKLEEKP